MEGLDKCVSRDSHVDRYEEQLEARVVINDQCDMFIAQNVPAGRTNYVYPLIVPPKDLFLLLVSLVLASAYISPPFSPCTRDFYTLGNRLHPCSEFGANRIAQYSITRFANALVVGTTSC